MPTIARTNTGKAKMPRPPAVNSTSWIKETATDSTPAVRLLRHRATLITPQNRHSPLTASEIAALSIASPANKYPPEKKASPARMPV